jgi:hypothetical protein
MDSMESAGCVHSHYEDSISKKLTLKADKDRAVPWLGGISPGPLTLETALFSSWIPITPLHEIPFQDNVLASASGCSVLASSTITPLSSPSKAPTSQPTGSTPRAPTSTMQSLPFGSLSESGTGSSALSHGSSLPGGISQNTPQNSNEHRPQATTHTPAPITQSTYHPPPPYVTMPYPGGFHNYSQTTNAEQSSQVPPPNPQVSLLRLHLALEKLQILVRNALALIL